MPGKAITEEERVVEAFTLLARHYMIIPIHLHAKGQESNIMFDYSLLLQPRLAYEYHTCRALIPGMIFKKEREHFLCYITAQYCRHQRYT